MTLRFIAVIRVIPPYNNMLVSNIYLFFDSVMSEWDYLTIFLRTLYIYFVIFIFINFDQFVR